MTYTTDDAAWDDMWQRLSDELYPEHRDHAIEEFTVGRLQSYYVKNPTVMLPALGALAEADWLKDEGRNAAAVVFYACAVELLLKVTLLKPVVHGLVHNAALAEVLVQHVFSSTGADRYVDLLAKLFRELACIDIKAIKRTGCNETLMSQWKAQQELRNAIIHRGEVCTAKQCADSSVVTGEIYARIVCPMLTALGLTVIADGTLSVSTTASV